MSKDLGNQDRTRRRPFRFWVFSVIGALALMALAPLAGYQIYLIQIGDPFALGNLTPTTQAVATFTPTPLVAKASGEITPVPLDGQATNVDDAATVLSIGAVATPTPGDLTPGQQSLVPTQRTITLEDIAPNAGQSTPPTAAPPTVTPTVPAGLEGQLAQAIQLHRFGDYVAARSRLATLISDPATTQEVRQEARFYLAKGYLADDDYTEALEVLDQLDAGFTTATTAAAAPAPTFERRVEIYLLRALILNGAGRYHDSIAAYQQALNASPQLAALVQPRIAKAYIQLNDVTGAANSYRAAANAASDTVQKVVLLESLASTYSLAGQYTDAAAAYGEILGVAQNAGYRAQIQYEAGEALAQAGDEAGAIAHWRAATDEAPSTQYAYQALVRLVEHQVDFDLYKRGMINLAAQSWQPAVDAFTTFLAEAPADDTRRGTVTHMLGQAYWGLKDLDSATVTFNKVIADYPNCTCFGQAWIDSAGVLAAGGNSSGARRIYRTFARQYPNDALAAEALWMSGMSAIGEGNSVEAAVDLLSIAQLFPTSDRAPQALYTVGVGAYANHLYTESADALRRAKTTYPDYRWDAVGYWLGRAEASGGDRTAANAAWQAVVDRAPDIYYGILAAQAIRQLDGSGGAMVDLNNMMAIAGPPSRIPGDDGSQAFAKQWLAQWLKVDASTLGQLPPAVTDDPDWVAGQTFLAVDERGDGLTALGRVYARNQNDSPTLYALSMAFEQMQAYRLSLIAMARLLQFSPAGLVENAPLFLQKRAYPERFADLITSEATTYNIDPLLYFSLIRQESLFEEGARSSAAAQGLAQLIPATGEWVAQQLGYTNYSNDLVYRPYINVKFGAYYLDWVRNYLDGNLISALVGYNAGPRNSDIWREAAGIDDALFVEQLDMSEPRTYINTIVSNFYHYARLYGPR